jgi:hypothetical protein
VGEPAGGERSHFLLQDYCNTTSTFSDTMIHKGVKLVLW